MLNVKVEPIANGSAFFLEGQVNESFQMPALTNGKVAELHCMKVSRINSIGIKKWILYLQELDKQKVSYTFHEVSPALVEQFNVISNFGSQGKTLSVCLPYTCGKCNFTFNIVQTSEEILKNSCAVPSPACQKCNEPNAEFDDEEDGYLQFIANQK